MLRTQSIIIYLQSMVYKDEYLNLNLHKVQVRAGQELLSQNPKISPLQVLATSMRSERNMPKNPNQRHEPRSRWENQILNILFDFRLPSKEKRKDVSGPGFRLSPKGWARFKATFRPLTVFLTWIACTEGRGTFARREISEAWELKLVQFFGNLGGGERNHHYIFGFHRERNHFDLNRNILSWRRNFKRKKMKPLFWNDEKAFSFNPSKEMKMISFVRSLIHSNVPVMGNVFRANLGEKSDWDNFEKKKKLCKFSRRHRLRPRWARDSW